MKRNKADDAGRLALLDATKNTKPRACGRCNGYETARILGKGTCHAHPPTCHMAVGPAGQVALMAHFPPIDADGWCLEFHPKLFTEGGADV